MKYKEDWDEAKDRLTRLWNREDLGRPCIQVRAPSGRHVPVPVPATAEEKWTDPDFLVKNTLAIMENTWWGGEAVPSQIVMCGWIASWGATPHFDMNTIWFDTFEVDCDQPPSYHFDPDEKWCKRHEEAYMRVIDAAGMDDFLVGQPCLLPANDLFSMHMGTEEFLVNLLLNPEWMEEAMRQGTRATIEGRQYLRDLIEGKHAFWYGIAGWMPFWAPEPFLSTQADVSCMMSPEQYDRFILPELETYAEEYGALWYHLDGGDAKQHLPSLLAMDKLRVLQYTPAPNEPPNGPDHLDFYKQAQAAGKIVHIFVDPQHIERLTKELDPNLLVMLTYASSQEEGEELLANAVRWS